MDAQGRQSGSLRRAQNVVLLLLGGVTGLLLSELGARAFFPDMAGGNVVLRLTHERPNWARPDADYHHVGDGTHALAVPMRAQAGARRILIVGDSFTMGHGVGPDKRFGALLQHRLGSETQVDVLATSSHSPIIYRNVVRDALAAASYAAVVVLVDQTDPADDLIYRDDLAGDGSSRAFDVARLAERERIVDRAYAELLARFSAPASPRRWALYNLLHPLSLADYFTPGHPHFRYVQRSLGRGRLIAGFAVDPEAEDSRSMRALVLEYLGDIVALCREHRVPLLLAANPWEFQSSRRPRVTLQLPGPFPMENRLEQLLLDAFGNRPGVQVIRLTPKFRQHDDPSSLFIDFPAHEIHWNTAGHALVESVLHEQLLATVRRFRSE